MLLWNRLHSPWTWESQAAEASALLLLLYANPTNPIPPVFPTHSSLSCPSTLWKPASLGNKPPLLLHLGCCSASLPLHTHSCVGIFSDRQTIMEHLLSAYCMPDTVLITGTQRKANTAPAFGEAPFRGDDNIQITVYT